jgi:hypothetical protein
MLMRRVWAGWPRATPQPAAFDNAVLHGVRQPREELGLGFSGVKVEAGQRRVQLGGGNRYLGTGPGRDLDEYCIGPEGDCDVMTNALDSGYQLHFCRRP